MRFRASSTIPPWTPRRRRKLLWMPARPRWRKPNRMSWWRKVSSIRPSSGSRRRTLRSSPPGPRPQQVAASQTRAKSALAQVAQRKALVDQARLNLSYCTIVAPATGIVGKKTVEIGENVSPGQQLMAVVPLEDVWVIANFKETQLSRMKPGQRVEFTRGRLRQGV